MSILTVAYKIQLFTELAVFGTQHFVWQETVSLCVDQAVEENEISGSGSMNALVFSMYFFCILYTK